MKYYFFLAIFFLQGCTGQSNGDIGYLNGGEWERSNLIQYRLNKSSLPEAITHEVKFHRRGTYWLAISCLEPGSKSICTFPKNFHLHVKITARDGQLITQKNFQGMGFGNGRSVVLFNTKKTGVNKVIKIQSSSYETKDKNIASKIEVEISVYPFHNKWWHNFVGF